MNSTTVPCKKRHMVRCVTCGGSYVRTISAQTRHERTSMHHEGTGPMAPVLDACRNCGSGSHTFCNR